MSYDETGAIADQSVLAEYYGKLMFVGTAPRPELRVRSFDPIKGRLSHPRVLASSCQVRTLEPPRL